MGVGRIKQLNNEPAPPDLGRLARAAAQENLRQHYQRGLEDGARMVLERLIDNHGEGPEVVTRETVDWARDCLKRAAASPRKAR